MTTITLPLTHHLIAGFAATAVHASKAKDSPHLQVVRVTLRTFAATDKHSIGEFTHTTLAESIDRHGEDGPADPNATVMVPSGEAAWMSKLAKTVVGAPGATLEFAPTRVRAIDVSGEVVASTQFAEHAWNYPPIEQLLPPDGAVLEDGVPFALALPQLSKITKAADLVNRAASPSGRSSHSDPIMFRSQRSEGGKSRPVIVEVGERLLMVIQPTLTAR